MIYQSVAHAVAEPEGRHAGLLAEDAAQVRGVVVMKALGYLLYGQVGGIEQVLDHQPDLYVDLFLGRGAEIFTVDDVQVIGGDVEPVGIIGHVVMPGVMPAQHGDEVVGQHPRPVLGRVVAKLSQPPFYLIGHDVHQVLGFIVHGLVADWLRTVRLYPFKHREPVGYDSLERIWDGKDRGLEYKFPETVGCHQIEYVERLIESDAQTHGFEIVRNLHRHRDHVECDERHATGEERAHP